MDSFWALPGLSLCPGPKGSPLSLLSAFFLDTGGESWTQTRCARLSDRLSLFPLSSQLPAGLLDSGGVDSSSQGIKGALLCPALIQGRSGGSQIIFLLSFILAMPCSLWNLVQLLTQD